ncbi:MAG: hypothetical protein JOZ72_10145 [Alphaproteobacteria bacterium]|nr:hypothetical protein [Alphaproteobacteria bacterium]
MKVRFGVIISPAFRALCAAGLFACAANGALADSSAPKAPPLNLSEYSTAADFDTITPRARLAGQFDLGPSDALLGMPGGEFAAPASGTAAGSIPVLDGVNLDFGVGADLAGRFNSYDAAGSKLYDGLFFSAGAVNSPYASVANGGSYLASSVALSDGLRFTFGEASLGQGLSAYTTSPAATVARLGGAPDPFDTRSANSLLAGVSLDVAPWAGIGVTASQTSEHDGLLGAYNPAVRQADTQALGVSARLQLGGGWMTTASFAQAITKLDLKPGLNTAPDELPSRSYGIAVAKRGLFGNDAMGVAVTRPAPGTAGSEFDLVSGIGSRPQMVPQNFLVDPGSPETDFELGYVTTFLDGSVALQTNAAYQMNYAGQSGNNAVSFLSRAKIKF